MSNRLADSVLPPAIDTNRFAVLEQLLDRITNEDIGSVLVMLTDMVTPTALDYLADHFSLLDEGWTFIDTDDHKRELIKSAIEIHRHKGTPWALKKLIAIYELDVEIVEWFDTHKLPRSLRAKDVDLLTDVSKVNQVIRALPSLKENVPVSNTLNVVSVQKADMPNYLTIANLGQAMMRGVTSALVEDIGRINHYLSAGLVSISSIPTPFTNVSINDNPILTVLTANYSLHTQIKPIFRILSK